MITAAALRVWGMGAALAALAACAPQPLPTPAATPISGGLTAYYATVQSDLLARGLMRTDGGADIALNAPMLTENFLRIALSEEYASGGALARSAPITLTRWHKPVRVAVTFGASVPPDQQARTRGEIASYLARLARLTGHDIGLSQDDPNFFISIADLNERRNLGPTLRAALPQLNAAQVAGVTNLNRDTYCLVWTQSQAQTGSYDRAFVFIPAEHPDLMRQACIHEELAQALGLPNDSGLNRPSIFNDDEEFALLTRQDELMLRLLYDPALRPGMTEAQARPIVETLARRLLGGNS